MLKKLILALGATALLAAPMFAQTADELIEKNIKAHGGEKMKGMKSVRMTGNMKMGPIEAPFTISKTRPENVRMEFTVQGMTGMQAYDGTTGWAVMPFMGKKDPEKLAGDLLDDIKEEADFDGPMVDYKAKGNKVESLGKVEVEGTSAYKLKITRKNGSEQTVYLDADNYLEIKSEGKRKIQGQETETETVIGNYKEVDGVLFPTQIENHVKGREGAQTFTISKIEVNPTIDAASFAMPAVAKTEEAPKKQ
jgi:outer membrane lipoprotein-sorting protein